MSDIQFDTDQIQYSRPTRLVTNQQQLNGVGFGSGGGKGMAGWLVRKGIIKDESQAGGILIGVVIFNFILTGVVIYLFVL